MNCNSFGLPGQGGTGRVGAPSFRGHHRRIINFYPLEIAAVASIVDHPSVRRPSRPTPKDKIPSNRLRSGRRMRRREGRGGHSDPEPGRPLRRDKRLARLTYILGNGFERNRPTDRRGPFPTPSRSYLSRIHTLLKIIFS